MTTRIFEIFMKFMKITWNSPKSPKSSEIIKNVTPSQAKRSVLKTGFVKSSKPTSGNPQNRVLIVVQPPKGSIQKKPGEPLSVTSDMLHRAMRRLPWWCTRCSGTRGRGVVYPVMGYWVLVPGTGTGYWPQLPGIGLNYRVLASITVYLPVFTAITVYLPCFTVFYRVTPFLTTKSRNLDDFLEKLNISWLFVKFHDFSWNSSRIVVVTFGHAWFFWHPGVSEHGVTAVLQHGFVGNAQTATAICLVHFGSSKTRNVQYSTVEIRVLWFQGR